MKAGLEKTLSWPKLCTNSHFLAIYQTKKYKKKKTATRKGRASQKKVPWNVEACQKYMKRIGLSQMLLTSVTHAKILWKIVPP